MYNYGETLHVLDSILSSMVEDDTNFRLIEENPALYKDHVLMIIRSSHSSQYSKTLLKQTCQRLNSKAK